MVLSLKAEGVCFAYGDGPLLLDGVSFALAAGETLCLLGPNGTGKTTLLRCLLGLERPRRGRIEVQGRDRATLGPAEAARAMAYVPQDSAAVFALSAFDVVLMGRSPHLGFMAGPTAEDRRLARAAMARLGILNLAERPVPELSGGERQLVLIARALAQGSTVLVMDEPFSGLDLGNQVRTVAIVRALAADGYTILLTTHLPDHAFALGGRVALLKGGRLAGPAAPEALLTPEALRRLYGTPVDVVRLGDGRTVCVPAMPPG